jgi:molybdopterin converting factor small subunit
MATPPIWAARKTVSGTTARSITVRVLAFARLRELLGFGERSVALAEGATLEDVWSALVAGAPQLAALRGSTRFARNGVLVNGDAVAGEGDELALLPPVGGG